MSQITQREQNLFESLVPIVEPLGVHLLDVEIKTHGDRPTIRVIIYSERGVGSETCRRVSENVSPVLDLEDLGFPGTYDLEVSSPGVKRRLRRPAEYKFFVDRDVEVTCYAPYREHKTWKGVFRGQSEEGIVIDTPNGETVTIPENKVASIRLFFDPEEALKSGGRSPNE